MGIVKFLPIQEGEGTPSPTNVRPIRAPLNLDGIGEVYGGELDTLTGVLTEVWKAEFLSNYEWAFYNGSQTGDTGVSRWRTYDIPIVLPDSRNDRLHGLCNKLEPIYYNASWANQFKLSPSSDGTATFAILSPMTKDEASAFFETVFLCYELATPITHQLTTAQLHQALDQLGVAMPSMRDIRRRITLNTPHKVTPTSAGLVTFETNARLPLAECKVHFSPVQEGTGDPSPDNVRAITGWTGVEVHRDGVNLFDENFAYSASSYSVAGSYAYFYTEPIFLKPNTTYYLDAVGNSDWNTAMYWATVTYTGDSYAMGATSRIVYVRNNTYCQDSLIQTGPTGAIRFAINKQGYATIQDALDDFRANCTLCLALGSTATAYEPYQGQTVALDWTDEAGTVYGGYVDLVTGEVWETWVKSTVRNLFTNIYTWGTTSVFWAIHIAADVSSGYSEIMSDKYPTIGELMPVSRIQSMADQSLAVRAVYGHPLLKDTRYATVEELHAAMGDTEICYHTATPILVTTLTPAQLKTLKGTNNIWSSANGNIDLTYWKH